MDFDRFCDEFAGDLVFEVTDKEFLLAAVVAEEKEKGCFEIHLFCPRRSSEAEYIVFAAREMLCEHPRVFDCVFILPALETRVIRALEKAGAHRTNWQFVNDQGVTMTILVWNAKND